MKESVPLKKGPDLVKALLEDPLQLPEDPEFTRQRVQMTYAQFLELSKRGLVQGNSRPDFFKQRLARSFDQPFELFD